MDTQDQRERVTAPELEQFVVDNVLLTGVTLGAGAYGSVEEVEIPGARVAAKKLHTQLINLGSPEQVDKWATDFVEECKLMSQLRHPHIVQFLGVAYLPGSQLPVLLMEKLQTSLDDLLETSPNIPLSIKVYLLTGTARGVVYLHGCTPPIAHRDLTARNILIDSGMIAKIADLGVAKMVNIQPGQLAATMTRGPGNNLYMPPETVQEEGATRYSTSIDIFSFGVVSLFTLTQTFPKDLKPPNYFDSVTKQLIARSEVERREDYVTQMKTAFGETHPLVKLTLDCLEYLPGDRPAAVEVLRRLEEVGRTVPQNCTETKLELIQQISGKDKTIQQIQVEHQRELTAYHVKLIEKDVQIAHLQAENDHLQQIEVEHQKQLTEYGSELSEKDTQIARLQAEEQEQVRTSNELIANLEVQRGEIEQLSGQLGSLELALQIQEEQFQGSLQNARSGDASDKSTTVPSSITFNWRKCRNRPSDMSVDEQPVTIYGKLYVKGRYKRAAQAVLVYTPDRDLWAELPSPFVENFTIATVRDQLLIMRHSDKFAENTIFTFTEHSEQWVQSYPAMPTARTFPAVIGYQDYLIVMGGQSSNYSWIPNVDILDTTTKKWRTAQPLPCADTYNTTIVEDTLYLIGRGTKTVLRARVPTLLSGDQSGVWKTLQSTPYYWSSPVTNSNILLTVGGSDKPWGSIHTTSIQMYDPTTNQWTGVGDLPEAMTNSRGIIINSELFVFGSSSVYISSLKYEHTV